LQILVVDDELSMREYLDLLLAKAGYDVRLAATLAEAERALADGTVDLVISDMKLGTESGLSVLRTAQRVPFPPEVILITAYGTPAAAVEAMREGAYDYICKPFDNEELQLLVAKALEKRELLLENQQLRKSVGPGGVLVGGSTQMREIWALVQKVAAWL
jgi:two-component system response regulator PilR (NtrC family)